MRRFTEADISLSKQLYFLKAKFPQGRGLIKKNKLVWFCQLELDEAYGNYTIKILYDLNSSPKVYVIEPNLYDITDGIYGTADNRIIIPAASDKAVAMFKNHPSVEALVRNTSPKGERDPGIFPHNENYTWNNDFFGPLYIPEAGKTIELNTKVLPLYKRVISEYERNDVRVEGDNIYINDVLATNYTFKQDYYWMMGDNRNNSLDARAWGFVPFDHVVGKPVFIWMSIGNFNAGIKNWSIRWDRVFTTVSGKGERVSYLIPFLVVLFGWIGFNKWRKRKKANS